MKSLKKILILFAMLLCINSYAQNYKPCLDGEMIRWSFINEIGIDMYPLSTGTIAFGDTTINDFEYKKLYLYCCPISLFPEFPSNTTWQDYTPNISSYDLVDDYFIRESEDASKLYIYSDFFGSEYLMSDLNLQEGDTINMEYDYDSNYVDSFEAVVDSVYFIDGLKHVRLHIGNTLQAQFTFVESAGPDKWFTDPQVPFESYGLNCFKNQTTFYKNNRIMYANFCKTYYNYSRDFSKIPCGYIGGGGVGIESNNEEDCYIFMQPNQIIIAFTQEMNANIHIYDINGKVVYKDNNFLNKKLIIPRNTLPNGVYILNVFNNSNGIVKSDKFILY